jgi:hypothetical protein
MKDEAKREPDFEVANTSIHLKSFATSMAGKYIPVEMPGQRGFTPLFWCIWSFPAPTTGTSRRLHKRFGPFPWVSSRY